MWGDGLRGWKTTKKNWAMRRKEKRKRKKRNGVYKK
jgi:hypothetical protein